MKKEVSRDDERKLYEAYEVLDRLCNDHCTVDLLVKEKISKIYNEVERLFKVAIANAYACNQYYKASEISYQSRKSLYELFEKIL